MMKIDAISKNLTLDSSGVWVANHLRHVSYPEDGNEACFEIEDESFWFRHRNHVLADLVRRYSPNDPLFDIGGGNGCVSHALQAQGLDVVLVEPGRAGVNNARKRGVRTIVHSTLEDAGFEPASLASVGIFDVLEHIESDAFFLEMLHRYLKPNGFLYLTVPAYRFLWSVEDVHAGHFRRYTNGSLAAVLRETGFEILFSSYLFSFLVPPVFALRAIPSWLGIRKEVSVATAKKEHSQGGGLASAIVDRLLRFEQERIRAGKKLPFGSSCLAVARKR